MAITDDVIYAAITWSTPSGKATVPCRRVIRTANRTRISTGASGYLREPKIHEPAGKL